MTRKDYIIIADALEKAGRELEQPNRVDTVAKYIAVALQRDNPNFNRERFLKASGVSNG